MVSPLGNFRSEVFICVLLEPSIIARSILGWTSSQSDQNNNLFQKHGVRRGTFKERIHYKKTCLTKTFTGKSYLAGICPFPFSEEKKTKLQMSPVYNFRILLRLSPYDQTGDIKITFIIEQNFLYSLGVRDVLASNSLCCLHINPVCKVTRYLTNPERYASGIHNRKFVSKWPLYPGILCNLCIRVFEYPSTRLSFVIECPSANLLDCV